MIIQEKEDCWELIKQHDHAALSWQVAKHWHKDFFPHPSLKEEVLLAVRQHDRAWISLDEQIRWNENEEKPYDFVSYPLAEKLAAYKRGINEVEKMSRYAGMLSSLHYTSFFSNGRNGSPLIDQFLEEECRRRKKIHSQLDSKVSEEVIKEHLKLLQFSDDLSLYICLNRPGVKKEEEFPWFKNGFRQRFSFAEKAIIAEWVTEKEIELKPFPFTEAFEIELQVYRVGKSVEEKSTAENWLHPVPLVRRVKLIEKTDASHC